jgi:hypothetical protein
MQKHVKVTRPRLLPSGSHDTRRNLPSKSAQKRRESNFLKKFENAYFVGNSGRPLASRELAVEGFGRADLVWLVWSGNENHEDFTALALRHRVRLTAIEGKVSDWRKGLQQAFRYRYFAHRSLLVLPMQTAKTAAQFLDTFRQMRVGLWGFDEASGRLHKWCTPRSARPMNEKAWRKALRVFESGLKLRKVSERL